MTHDERTYRETGVSGRSSYPMTDAEYAAAKEAYETDADVPPFIPHGYRRLAAGEPCRVGDIRWSAGKWYSMLSPATDGWPTPANEDCYFARKVL